MKVALTLCILSLAFLAIFSAESAGKKESLQNVHNKRAVNHKGKKNKRFNNKRISRRGKRLRNKGKGRKESRQSSTCDKDQAFKDYKKAVQSVIRGIRIKDSITRESLGGERD